MIHQKILNVKSKIGTIGKDAHNQNFKYKYATLDKIFDRLEPLLIQEKLSVYIKSWEFSRSIDIDRKAKEGTYQVTLVMYHVVAEIIDVEDTDNPTNRIVFTFDVPMDSQQDNFIQAFGSTTTYLRKYALAIMFDISFGDEDDPDRTLGSDIPVPAPTNSKKFEDLKKPITYADKKQQRQIYNAQITAKVSDNKLTEIINACGGSDWNDIPADQVETVINLIKENARP